jgi:hypothetical protein
MPNWYIVTRRNHDTFEVWIDEDEGPTIGANSIVIGQGPTRAKALADAHDELTNLTTSIVGQLRDMHADAIAGLERERAAREATRPEPMGLSAIMALQAGSFDVVEPYPDADPVIVLRSDIEDPLRPHVAVGGITAREAFERLLAYARSWEHR